LGTEIAGIILLVVLKVCLAIAGIGGGSLVVALAMALFGFTTKPAIALSSFATFISTLGAFFFNFRLRHPDKPQCVLVDYGLACLMMPTTLAGAQIGAMMLSIFPNVYL
jgi:uncharacterized membrane protein YfcA